MASWPFHQYFDGLHTSLAPGHPMIAIHHTSTEHQPKQMDDFPGELRTRVDIVIECFQANVARDIGRMLKNGSEQLSVTEWKTFVHVKDAEMFRSCLKWKYEKTKQIWQEYY